MSFIPASMIFKKIGNGIKKTGGYSDVQKAVFKLYYIKDDMEILTFGIKDNKVCVQKRIGIKISENSEIADIMVLKVKEKIKMDDIQVVYYTIDFKQKKCTTELYYTLEGKKLNQNLEINF